MGRSAAMHIPSKWRSFLRFPNRIRIPHPFKHTVRETIASYSCKPLDRDACNKILAEFRAAYPAHNQWLDSIRQQQDDIMEAGTPTYRAKANTRERMECFQRVQSESSKSLRREVRQKCAQHYTAYSRGIGHLGIDYPMYWFMGYAQTRELFEDDPFDPWNTSNS